MDAFPSTHPTSESLRAYSLGRLDDTSAEAVGRHLEQCPECLSLVAEMTSDTFLDKLRGVQAGPMISASSAEIPAEAQTNGGGATLLRRPPETRLRPVLPLVLNQPRAHRRLLPANSPKQR